MQSAPSRSEVEHLHRLMMQASNEAAQIEKRFATVQKDTGLSIGLRKWHDAADAIEALLRRLAAELLAGGTPRGQLDRVGQRLAEIKTRSRKLDLERDLDLCAGHWKSLGVELGQFSGRHRDTLVRLLEQKKPVIDEVTAQLSRARSAGGLLPESFQKARVLQEERDRARAKYEGLRRQFLDAERASDAAGKLPKDRRALPLPAEHHTKKFDHGLGSLIEARAARGAAAGKDKLARQIGARHDRGSGVATRLEKTLHHLATASHRVLTDAHHGEVRNHLARMDSILARLRGKAGRELAEGAQEVGQVLSAIGSMASSKQGAQAVHEFRKLIDDRRSDLLKMFGRSSPTPPAAGSQRAQIEQLRKLNPGLEKILRGASAAQLAAQLARQHPSALSGLQSRGPQAAQNVFGGLHGGTHLGGFGGGHRGGLAALSGTTALSKALDAELARKTSQSVPRELLADLKKAPAGTPIHELAKKAEERHKELLRRHPVRKGPSAAKVTADALTEVFRAHPKGEGYLKHVAPGGAIWELCNAAQRSHGLPVAQFASHFLQGRGQHKLLGAVQTFNTLVKEGHRPHFGLFDRLKSAVGSVGHAVSSVASSAAHAASGALQAA